jgi:hypothetical protein
MPTTPQQPTKQREKNKKKDRTFPCKYLKGTITYIYMYFKQVIAYTSTKGYLLVNFEYSIQSLK